MCLSSQVSDKPGVRGGPCLGVFGQPAEMDLVLTHRVQGGPHRSWYCQHMSFFSLSLLVLSMCLFVFFIAHGTVNKIKKSVTLDTINICLFNIYCSWYCQYMSFFSLSLLVQSVYVILISLLLLVSTVNIYSFVLSVTLGTVSICLSFLSLLVLFMCLFFLLCSSWCSQFFPPYLSHKRLQNICISHVRLCSELRLLCTFQSSQFCSFLFSFF